MLLKGSSLGVDCTLVFYPTTSKKRDHGLCDEDMNGFTDSLEGITLQDRPDSFLSGGKYGLEATKNAVIGRSSKNSAGRVKLGMVNHALVLFTKGEKTFNCMLVLFTKGKRFLSVFWTASDFTKY